MHTVQAMNARRKKAWSLKLSLGELKEGTWGFATSVWKTSSFWRKTSSEELLDPLEEQDEMNWGDLNLEEMKRKWRCCLWRRLKDLVVVVVEVCGKARNEEVSMEFMVN